MTSVAAESTTVTTRPVTVLPRVNLLPREVGQLATFRKVQVGLGAGVLAALGVVGLLVASASGSVAQAQQDMDAASAQQSSLQAETNKYSQVTAIQARAAAAQQQLTTAMGDEVRFSQLLSDLSLTIPSTVWFKNVTFTPGGAVPAAAPAAPPAPAAGAAGAAGAAASKTAVAPVAPVPPGAIGTVAMTGVALNYNDVATLLEAVATLRKTYSDPYLSNGAEALLNGRKVVNFNANAVLVSTAMSGRYSKVAN